MGYMHIDNLYKNRDILLFKECYALEKLHGTSVHISWKDSKISFFSGGVKYSDFVSLFDEEKLIEDFIKFGVAEITIFGEAYGGKCQGMRETYGNDLKFAAFEVKIGDSWINVPKAEKIVKSFDLDFVPYVKCSTDIEELDAIRDMPSEQSVKCGIVEPKKREGIVLRPLIEVRKNNGERIIAKHKAIDFIETRTPRKLNEDRLKILEEANEIADEWVTEMRLTHVLDKFPDAGIEKTGDIIKAMVEDVEREAKDEIVMSREARRAISKKAAKMFKQRLMNQLKE